MKPESRRYRKVSVQIWGDAKFFSMSHEGQLAFLFILTHPNMTGIGAMRATMDGLSAELNMDRKGFREPFDKGLVKASTEAPLITLPNFIKHNPPENPNVVKGWLKILDTLPECELLEEHIGLVLQALKGYGEHLAEPFTEGLPETGTGTGTGVPPCSPPVGDETISNNQSAESESAESDPASEDVEAIRERWNAMALANGLRQIRKWTDARQRKARARLQDADWRDHWREAVEAIPKYPFLCGENDKGWLIDIDKFLKPDTVNQILEGKYGRKSHSSDVDCPQFGADFLKSLR